MPIPPIMTGNILIAEDDTASRELLSRLLSQAGYAVVPSVDGEDALTKITDETSLAIVDLRMPKLSGFACLEEIRKTKPNTPVIVVSAAGTKDAVQAMQQGAFSFVQKPFNRNEILQSVEEALSASSELKKEAERNTPLKALLPNTDSVQFEERLKSQLDAITSADKPVLLVGERGAPSRQIARYLYERVVPSGKPFVEVNLHALSIHQAYRELFGSSDETGKWTHALSGVLFMQELGKTPYRVQRELLARMKDHADETLIVFSSIIDPESLLEHGASHLRENGWFFSHSSLPRV